MRRKEFDGGQSDAARSAGHEPRPVEGARERLVEEEAPAEEAISGRRERSLPSQLHGVHASAGRSESRAADSF